MKQLHKSILSLSITSGESMKEERNAGLEEDFLEEVTLEISTMSIN